MEREDGSIPGCTLLFFLCILFFIIEIFVEIFIGWLSDCVSYFDSRQATAFDEVFFVMKGTSGSMCDNQGYQKKMELQRQKIFGSNYKFVSFFLSIFFSILGEKRNRDS